MSYIFRGQVAPIDKVHFEPYTQPDPKGVYSGDMWNDAASQSLHITSPAGLLGINDSVIYSNFTTVPLADPTTATTLFTFAPLAGAFNVVGKGFAWEVRGSVAPNTSNDTLVLAAYFGTSGTNVSLFSFTSGTITAGDTTGFVCRGYAVCSAVGATGTLYTNSDFICNIGSGSTVTVLTTTNNTSTSAIDLSTATAENFVIQANLGTGHASSVVNGNSLIVRSIN
jgi:hypothetical protein